MIRIQRVFNHLRPHHPKRFATTAFTRQVPMSSTPTPRPPRTPPQGLPSFTLTPDSLLSETHSIIERTRKLEDHLASTLTPETATFANLIAPLAADDAASRARTSILTLPASVSADQSLRDAAREAEKLLSRATTESLARLDIARLVGAVHERSIRDSEEEPDGEDRHYLERLYGLYRRNGLALGEGEERERFLAMKNELQEVLTAAKKALVEADDGVWFRRDELEGVPDRVLFKLPRREGDDEVYRVTFQPGHLTPVMQNAVRSEARKRLYLARANRFPENVARLKDVVRLRDALATMLGYEHHAALRMEDKMSESVEEVLELLGDLKTRLGPLAKAEIETMLAIKREDLEERLGDAAPKEELETLYFWDWGFYNQKLKRERYAVDAAKIAEYFEVWHTLKGMLSVFERLFGLVFRPGDGHAWHEDVVLYTVWDNDDLGGEFLGYLYIDLFARNGKFSGAHHISLVPGVIEGGANGPRRYQVSAVICNFNKPTSDQPTLLLHREVKSLFHELGHAIHYLASRTKYAMGFSRDFVEIPSVMLENWIWVPDVLAELGRHYSLLGEEYARHWRAEQQKKGSEVGVDEPEEKLPRRLAEDLAGSRSVNGAHDMLYQIQLALFDLGIHTTRDHGGMDFTRLWNEGLEATMGLVGLVDGRTGDMLGVGQGGFGHIFRAYDAGYFAYALARICAADLYSSTFAANPMDRATGLWYRRSFLEPGASRPEGETLRGILGRKPSSVAYFRELAKGASVEVPGL